MRAHMCLCLNETKGMVIVMKTTAVRIHGVRDLRVDSFELPEIGEDELLVRIMADSLCLSTYKVAQKGSAHKKLPEHLEETPIVMGHEFCGIVERAGAKWQDTYKPGDCFVAQPNLGRADTYSLGYSFPYVGGESTYSVVMNEAVEKGCLLPYRGESYFEAAMAEPLSCVVAGFKANFHLRDRNDYDYLMGVKQGGAMAIVGGTGPMGSLAVDLAVHGKKRPSLLVVTGRTQTKLERLSRLYPVEEAAANGVKLHYVNTADDEKFSGTLRALAGGGFDDVFVMAADAQAVCESEKLLGWDGCLNFFAGPIDSAFTAPVNFYNVNYNATHFVGTSGSNTKDMVEAVELIEKGVVQVGKIATHVMGLNAVPEAILNLPDIPGGKKICYPQKRYPLTAVGEFGKTCTEGWELELAQLLKRSGGIWNREAEEHFLKNAPDV